MSKCFYISFLLYYIIHTTNSLLEELAVDVAESLVPVNYDTVKGLLDDLPLGVQKLLSPFEEILKNNGLTTTYNIKTVPYPTLKVYDFILIGAGTAGAVVANRLSEVKKWNVLLLEAGGEETALNQIPVLYALPAQTHFNYGYRLAPQKDACMGMKDGLCTAPRGKSFGGTSSINAMFHTRGNKLDYDIWANMGNTGWSYEDVLPYFIKSENFKVKDVPADCKYHGTEGNVCVQSIPYRTKLAKDFLKAGVELGYDIVDYNGAEQIGFSHLQVNMDDGARCSSGRAYLRVDRPNLDIVSGAFVTKILIDEQKRAYGVEYVKNGQTRTVRASKEVISCAGTMNGAQLLMVSGIGPKEDLEKLGIEVIKDSKVGYNMYEHVATWGLLFTTNSTDPLIFSDLLKPHNILSYALHRNGQYSYPASVESIAFVKTKSAPDDRPNVEILFIGGSHHSDNGLTFKPSYGISDEVYNQFYKPLEFKHIWSVWPIVQHPKSCGRITITSKDPMVPPVIDPNLFSDPDDVETILEGIKFAIKISETPALQKHNSKVYDRPLLGCENFEFGCDDYWRCVIRTIPVMENHEMGTCKMGNASDPDAVVDSELRVYGIDGLRVIDASIMPTMTTGHICAGVYMIGEKGADMVKKTYGCK